MLGRRIAILVIVLLGLIGKNLSLEPYDLPVIPDSIKQKLEIAKATNTASDKHIPRKAWIAVRNVSDTKPNHMLGPNGFIQRNSNWNINFCDNEMKDSFMEQQYAGSSILWAYNILNPAIGTSKVEIWRLAVLYLYGGANVLRTLQLLSVADDCEVVGLRVMRPVYVYAAVFALLLCSSLSSFFCTCMHTHTLITRKICIFV